MGNINLNKVSWLSAVSFSTATEEKRDFSVLVEGMEKKGFYSWYNNVIIMQELFNKTILDNLVAKMTERA